MGRQAVWGCLERPFEAGESRAVCSYGLCTQPCRLLLFAATQACGALWLHLWELVHCALSVGTLKH